MRQYRSLDSQSLAQFATVSSIVAENRYVWCAGTPGLGSGNLVPFDFLVHRRAVDVEHRSRRFYVAARVLQGRRDEQSLKLLECRADRGVPDRTRLRWRGIDAIRKGARITAAWWGLRYRPFPAASNHITDIAACLATLRGFGPSMHLIFPRDKRHARRAVPRLLQW